MASRLTSAASTASTRAATLSRTPPCALLSYLLLHARSRSSDATCSLAATTDAGIAPSREACRRTWRC
eukprot:4997621-Pleurochrysis_carterae.AAC.1